MKTRTNIHQNCTEWQHDSHPLCLWVSGFSLLSLNQILRWNFCPIFSGRGIIGYTVNVNTSQKRPVSQKSIICRSSRYKQDLVGSQQLYKSLYLFRSFCCYIKKLWLKLCYFLYLISETVEFGIPASETVVFNSISSKPVVVTPLSFSSFYSFNFSSFLFTQNAISKITIFSCYYHRECFVLLYTCIQVVTLPQESTQFYHWINLTYIFSQDFFTHTLENYPSDALFLHSQIHVYCLLPNSPDFSCSLFPSRTS